MDIEFRNGLLYTTLSVCFQGRTKVINNVIID